jgi:hypothetical protein
MIRKTLGEGNDDLRRGLKFGRKRRLTPYQLANALQNQEYSRQTHAVKQSVDLPIHSTGMGLAALDSIRPHRAGMASLWGELHVAVKGLRQCKIRMKPICWL